MTRTTKTKAKRTEPSYKGIGVKVRPVAVGSGSKAYVVQLALRQDWFIHLTRDTRWEGATDEDWAPYAVSHLKLGMRIGMFHSLEQAIGAAEFMGTVMGGAESMTDKSEWFAYPRHERLRWGAMLLERYDAVGLGVNVDRGIG